VTGSLILIRIGRLAPLAALIALMMLLIAISLAP
jgi:hypothetical protein